MPTPAARTFMSDTGRYEDPSSHNIAAAMDERDVANDNCTPTDLPLDMQFNEGHVLLITCYSAIMVVSLVGNLCVLRAILDGSRRQRKSRVNYMLLHLAIADLIVSKRLNLCSLNLKGIKVIYNCRHFFMRFNNIFCIRFNITVKYLSIES